MNKLELLCIILKVDSILPFLICVGALWTGQEIPAKCDVSTMHTYKFLKIASHIKSHVAHTYASYNKPVQKTIVNVVSNFTT